MHGSLRESLEKRVSTEKATMLKNYVKVYTFFLYVYIFETYMYCNKIIKYRGLYLLISPRKSLSFNKRYAIKYVSEIIEIHWNKNLKREKK